MIRLQADDRPTYILSYPRAVRWAKRGAILVLVAIALVNWGLAWLDFFQPVAQAARVAPLTITRFLEILAAQPLRPLLSAHLSLALVAGAVALIYHVLPDLSLSDQGLAVRTALGWRVIPWASVTTVRIVPFEESKRRLVLMQGTWTRWSPWPRLVSMCLGAGFEPGLLFTTDIRDFKPFMRRLYDEVHGAAPEALFDPEFFSLPARMVTEPVPTLEILVGQARDEGWPLSLSAQAMGAVAAGLVLVQLLVLLLFGGDWWKPILIVALCQVEWLIGAFYLFALAEFFPVHIELEESAMLYPMAQVPRALLAVPMVMLVAAGVPLAAGILGMVGVVWAVVLTAFLVQQVYHLETLLLALVGGAFQVMFQFIILGLALGS